jgi:hypothetical protein
VLVVGHGRTGTSGPRGAVVADERVAAVAGAAAVAAWKMIPYTRPLLVWTSSDSGPSLLIRVWLPVFMVSMAARVRCQLCSALW